jgi:hypothetical protein
VEIDQLAGSDIRNPSVYQLESDAYESLLQHGNFSEHGSIDFHFQLHQVVESDFLVSKGISFQTMKAGYSDCKDPGSPDNPDKIGI